MIISPAYRITPDACLPEKPQFLGSDTAISGARYYEPTSGRFLSPDPLGHASSMSLYDYCSGDPVNGFDPDGRLATKIKNFIHNFEIPLPGIGGDSAQEEANASVSDAYSNTMYPFDVANAFIDSIEIPAPGIGGDYAQDEFNEGVKAAKDVAYIASLLSVLGEEKLLLDARTPRTFTSSDPLVADLANEIEAT